MYPRSSVSFKNCNLNLRNLDSPSPDLRSSHIILNLILITACPSGHNFGSEHDPETTECAPAESDGGKFIMYPASVSGQWRNNKVHLPLYCVQVKALKVCFITGLPSSPLWGAIIIFSISMWRFSAWIMTYLLPTSIFYKRPSLITRNVTLALSIWRHCVATSWIFKFVRGKSVINIIAEILIFLQWKWLTSMPCCLS